MKSSNTARTLLYFTFTLYFPQLADLLRYLLDSKDAQLGRAKLADEQVVVLTSAPLEKNIPPRSALFWIAHLWRENAEITISI